MKYVVVNHPDHGEQVVMFPVTLRHDDVVSGLMSAVGGEREVTVVAAGFVGGIPGDGVMCHGRSESLGVESRVYADRELITNLVTCGVC